jgi:Acyltransferase family
VGTARRYQPPSILGATRPSLASGAVPRAGRDRLVRGDAGALPPTAHAARRRPRERLLLRQLALRPEWPVLLRPVHVAVADAPPLVAGDRRAVLPFVAARGPRLPVDRARSRKPLAAVCVAGIAASVAVMAILYEPLDPSRAYYGTDGRAHTFLVGAVLALLLTRHRAQNEPGLEMGRRARRERRAPATLHVVGVVAAAGVVWAWSRVSDQGSGLYRGGSLLFSLAVAAVIASAIQPGRSLLRVALSLPMLCWLGRISYGLYLWHWPAIVVLTEDRTGLSGATLTVARLATTLGAATLSFYLVEQPSGVVRCGAVGGGSRSRPDSRLPRSRWSWQLSARLRRLRSSRSKPARSSPRSRHRRQPGNKPPRPHRAPPRPSQTASSSSVTPSLHAAPRSPAPRRRARRVG